MAEDIEELKEWYSQQRENYAALAEYLQSTIKNLLKVKKIQNLGVFSRVKTLNSLLDKVKKKSYIRPVDQVFDVAGIRIITYLESEAKLVREVIENNFEIDQNNSFDKSKELGIDKIGYRSYHYVCRLSEPRMNLQENVLFRDLHFEVQVRTALQHAWAEIEHDRRYKLASSLPQTESRMLNLIAGELELADMNFDLLAKRIDELQELAADETREGVSDIPLSGPSIRGFLKVKLENVKNMTIEPSDGDSLQATIKELNKFGIQTLKDLSSLFNNDFIDVEEDAFPFTSEIGILRDAMMYQNPEKYFKEAWDSVWNSLEPELIEMLAKKHGKAFVKKLMAEYELIKGPEADYEPQDGPNWED